MVLFVGDEPSAQTDPSVAFKGAACEKRLMSWIKKLTDGKARIINRVDPDFDLIVFAVFAYGYPIIALGDKASKALKNIKHFKLPHPSGRNRQLNCSKFLDNKLKECKKYIGDYNV